jgi:hypothetical protein
MKYKEISQLDEIFYKGKTGDVFIIEVPEKGKFMMPNKKGINFPGNKRYIHKGEQFTYVKHEMLNSSKRIIRIQFVRKLDNSAFYIAEKDLIYFGAKT